VRRTVSAEATAETYRDFTAILDRLTATGQAYGVKDLLARYVEVIDRTPDPADGSAGSLDVMLLAQPPPGAEKEHPDTAGVTAGASGCNDLLPETASIQTGHLRSLGSWQIKRSGRSDRLHFFPWGHHTPPKPDPSSGNAASPTPKAGKRDPLALARFYQSLLDSRIVESRAALPPKLG
jgi:hypothetical protein